MGNAGSVAIFLVTNMHIIRCIFLSIQKTKANLFPRNSAFVHDSGTKAFCFHP